jgi:chromosome partitioning protein
VILSVISQKGGTGKTTVALNVAACAAQKKLRTLLIDADEQGSALAWAEVREEDPLFSVVGMPKATIHKELSSIASDYDLCVIDCPPRLQKIARSALAASDGVLIPVGPSPLDLWAVEEMVELLEEVSEFHEVKSAFVMNKKITGTAISKGVQQGLREFDVPLLKASLSQRVAFAEAAASGLSVSEYEPKSKATTEAKKLTNEVMKWLNLSR